MSSIASKATNLTSSQTGTFYFAFGSNLSPTQMRGRLTSSPTSSIPIAITRLDGWKWLICERGYANIVELPASSLPSSNPANDSLETDSTSDATTVWGVLYNLMAEDEATLDLYEGHDDRRNANPTPNPNVAERPRRPFLQGNWDYNKHYLPVTATQWLVDPRQFGLPPATEQLSSSPSSQITVLAYVDELRVRDGEIQREYVGRMNRAIDEGVELGLPGRWCENVMRRWIRPGVYPADRYFGTSEGYVEEEVVVGSEAT